jgi:ORF6N domain
MAKRREILLVEQIEPLILLVRGQKVLFDVDLAKLYGVTTKRLNEQVRRNQLRFPMDFRFQLTREETQNLRSQNATSSRQWGGRRYRPFAFTEHGAIMAASVLNTARATEVSVYVVRTFVKLRDLLASHKELGQKLADLERKVGDHDQSIQTLIAAIRQLMTSPPAPSRGRIGFKRADEA